MKTFDIEVRETLSKIVKIEAETSEEAIEEAKRRYESELIELTAEDFNGDVEYYDQTNEDEDLL